ncbi:Glycosyltransferase involved in cell wall bisynthesis [Modicisalibacter ilicicola DSM 19980]|uniref:Glycosyltransferase involved in cell wall bisynthesis n=1 Tax=Modicisalibacter ilicicola DSM 19980 TaxID=1121942 RepID=A0A1M5C0C8_9GAMM|nr:glycosyltransferase [Halomonas ilicicola]SHF48120.1 Glycosyltransferase involved in cell wall bisynthesis [Halomonas ilicicola DSM 19980]
MNIIYCCPFDTSIPTGKNRATRHKIEALKEISKDTFIIVPGGKGRHFSRVFTGVLCELRCIATILKYKKDIDYYISRGDVGIFSVPLAKFFGILTMREIHAGPFEELKLLKKPKLVKFYLKFIFYYSFLVNKKADVRIYNNPMLKEYFINKGWGNENDVVAYNGGSPDAVASIDKKLAMEKYSLDPGCKYLVFVGSTSKWRGVDLLVNLQQEFDKNKEPIKIICAGGEITKDVDPDRVLHNISPLDDVGCAEIIKCADACLLPVANNRVSPGSPLKLYDYMINGRPIVAQSEMPGYSDEIERYDVGIVVDFYNPEEARRKIVNFLQEMPKLEMYSKNAEESFSEYSWTSRVKSWFVSFSRAV